MLPDLKASLLDLHLCCFCIRGVADRYAVAILVPGARHERSQCASQTPWSLLQVMHRGCLSVPLWAPIRSLAMCKNHVRVCESRHLMTRLPYLRLGSILSSLALSSVCRRWKKHVQPTPKFADHSAVHLGSSWSPMACGSTAAEILVALLLEVKTTFAAIARKIVPGARQPRL